MISQRARIGFDKNFPQFLEESLRTETYAAWSTHAVDPKAIQAKRFIMLTISSYDFRLIVLLHFSSDTASMKYVADCLKIASEELTIIQYQDYLSEIGNILCGSIKRWLFQSFPHLGMSTPNQLGCESLKYIESYSIDHALHLQTKAADGTEFYSSLYVTSKSQLDFDPLALLKREEQVEMGALELF